MLIRQLDMPFDLYQGACNTFLQPKPIVLLCFDYYHAQDCYTWVIYFVFLSYTVYGKRCLFDKRSIKVSMAKITKMLARANMRMDIRLAWVTIKVMISTSLVMIRNLWIIYQLLNLFEGKALTTGCVGSECSLKTELMDMASLRWIDGPDYPFTSE